MGAFYTNVTLVGPSMDEVLTWMRTEGRSAFVAAEGGRIVVFDAGAEAQDGSNAQLGKSLSAAFECGTLAVTVHDDDILFLATFDAGSLVDDYNSAPGYFTWDGEGEPPGPSGGSPAELTRVFRSNELAAVDAALRGEFDSATERRRELAAHLRLPRWSAGFGYEYLAAGDRPPGLDGESLVVV